MTEQQKDFVQMYLKHNCKIIAHNIVYGNNPNYDSVESSANRLLRIPEIADTIRSIKDNIRHEVEEEFKAKYREELLSIYDKRMLLKRIATGELYVEQKYKGKNCTQCSQYISPTINQMLAAIREDSRLAGHYPYKQNGKWLIPAQQTEQEENSNNPEKDNKRQQLNETIIDNQPLTVEEENTTETPLPPLRGTKQLGGDIGTRLQAGKCQSGRLTPDGQETDETLEKDNNLAERFNEANEKDVYNRINRQHPEETHTDSQTLINSPHTSVNSSGQMISKEKLDELLYPNRQKRELNNNHLQKTTIMETETGE